MSIQIPCFRTGPILFCKNKNTDFCQKYSEDDIVKMIEFLIDNIFVMFCGYVFQQTVGIPVGTNCAPLLVNSSLCPYYADFIEGLSRKMK